MPTRRSRAERVAAREVVSAELPATGSERDLRAVLEGAHEAFIAVDACGVIMDCNPAAEATFGWPRQEAVGRTLTETIIPERYRESHRRGGGGYLENGGGAGVGGGPRPEGPR